MRTALILGRLVLLEARRTGLPWMVAGALAAALGLAGFTSQIALTEGAALQVGMLAALGRMCAVFLTAMFVVTSIVRETADKGTELLLSLPLSRTQYYLGKLAGFVACAVICAACFAAVLLPWAGPLPVLAWFASLALETALVAGLALFFVLGLGQVIPALAATAGLYLLARAIGTIQLVSRGPLAEESLLQNLAAWSVDAVATLLPSLDAATRTSWLVYGPPTFAEMGMVTISLLLYLLLTVAAGLFDLHRRNL